MTQSTATANDGGQHPGANGTDNQSFDLSSALAPIESVLQKGVDYAKANPMLAVAGTAAVAALLVMAAKRTPRHETSLAQMQREFDRFIARNSHVGTDVSQGVSSLVNRAMAKLDPAVFADLGQSAEKWVAQATSAVKSATQGR